jgi:hypothetical protein
MCSENIKMLLIINNGIHSKTGEFNGFIEYGSRLHIKWLTNFQ